jgi:PIN domain nuclease of toxin-antitoxin system
MSGFGGPTEHPNGYRLISGAKSKHAIRRFSSIASLWELAIKAALKEIAFPANPGTYAQHQLERQRFKLLDIDVAHIDAVALLPPHHRDPFDRLIVAQAKVEAFTVITADRVFAAYDILTVFI